MKLVTFIYEGRQQAGILDGDAIVPLHDFGFNDALSLIAADRSLQTQLVAQVQHSSTARLPLSRV